MAKIPQNLNSPFTGVMGQANEVLIYFLFRSNQEENFITTELRI